MPQRPSSSTSAILAALLLCLPSIPAFADDSANEIQWFTGLVKANYGKTFCAPSSTTYKDLGNVILAFAKAHPEFRGQLTDSQTIQGLAERYPCKANPELANTPLSKAGGLRIEVSPTGEFSSIDTKPTMAIVQKLHGTVGHENDDLIEQITKNGGNYMPPTLFAVAEWFYRQGDINNAIFWFNAARLRGTFDATLCTDVSARSAIPALIQQMPRELIKKQFDDVTTLKEIIDRVLKWDEATPYNYDHRWINLHGMRAINSGLGRVNSNEPLTVASDKWDALAKQTRERYQKSYDTAIETIQKQKAKAN